MLGFLTLLGVLLIAFPALKPLLERLRLSPYPVCIALGWLLRLVIPEPPSDLFFGLRLLGNLGLVLLLFHIGLESHLTRLLQLVRQAGLLALSNMLLSALLGLAVTLAFGFSWEVALFVAVSLTATSIAVSLAAWPKRQLDSQKGSLLLDMVAIDDIAAILIMALLLSAAAFTPAGLLSEFSHFVARLIALLALCYLFSHFVERRLVNRLIYYEKLPDSTLTVIAISVLIATFAAWLGFSLAIGAFFAGIAFSRDPRAVRIDAAMEMLYDLFTPFFFLWIGFQTVIGWSSLPFLAALLGAAVVGKLLGTWAPARMLGLPALSAWLFGLSAIPRAEISMVIAEQGLQLGVLPEGVYSSLALISLITCICAPVAIRRVVRRAT
jgi:Na+:H+ antiporter